MKRLLLSIFAVLLLTVGTWWAGSFEDADAAYKRGDYAEAVKWLRSLAAQGKASAQNRLGFMYSTGLGVAQNHKEAVKWHRLSAVQGHASAQYNLGVMYANGLGVAQDYVRAHMWLNLGATSDDAEAVNNRDFFAKKMTSRQIAQTQQMASDCQQKNFKGCD